MLEVVVVILVLVVVALLIVVGVQHKHSSQQSGQVDALTEEVVVLRSENATLRHTLESKRLSDDELAASLGDILRPGSGGGRPVN